MTHIWEFDMWQIASHITHPEGKIILGQLAICIEKK